MNKPRAASPGENTVPPEFWVIDRFEGRNNEQAVLESLSTREISARNRDMLPAGAKAGDMLRLSEGRFSIDGAATAERAGGTRARFERLKSRV